MLQYDIPFRYDMDTLSKRIFRGVAFQGANANLTLLKTQKFRLCQYRKGKYLSSSILLIKMKVETPDLLFKPTQCLVNKTLPIKSRIDTQCNDTFN